jgi:L-iditol 2-dehydrogenase
VQGLTKLAPGRGNVALAERPEPEPAPGHVVLEVHAAGICGTDIHIHDGEFVSNPPVTMGHEVSAVVAEIGDGVDPTWRGERVVTETYFFTCGECDLCRAGRTNLCPKRRSIGSHVDGGFARLVHVPAKNLHRIPDWLDARAAPMAEPLACCCHSLLDPDLVAAGDEVLVIGPGPVGLLAAQVARAAGGLVHLRGTPRDELRLDTARRLGFDVSTTDDGALAFEPTVVVECSGSEAGIAFGLETARRTARYVQIGLAGKPVTIPFDLVCHRELIVTSGNASTPASWRRAMELIEARAVELEPLLSEVVPLAEWERAFAATRAGAGIKYVLAP